MHLVPFRYLTFIATAAIFVMSLFYYDHYWLPVLAGALTLVGISAAFAVLSALWASALMLVIIGLTMLPLSLWFLRQGIWLDFGAPLMGIYFHRAWEDLLEKRSRKASATRKDEEHVIEK